MKKLRAVPFTKFAQVLQLLEAFFGPEVDGVCIVYASRGSGYLPRATGPSCPVAIRPPEEMVTVREIRSVLGYLGWSEQAFVDVEYSCEIHVPGESPAEPLSLEPGADD